MTVGPTSDRPPGDRPDSRERSSGARPLRSVVVLGGSLAGLLAARALAEFADVVTVVERDVLPDGPERRKNRTRLRRRRRRRSTAGFTGFTR
ncbi:hypothetical protein GCM10011579_017490 [Streptomyces albiflavescens]|uniref:Uncharacterized protein n=1 Tax=Streptomyces albiflavescens TaxID=1623582 RepID=A0A917XWM4_9ACTN|nr:hypothetical protein [Streptomyces albiflavescens]GGN56442.1 hypothetical protein GCM10011579_017490 [Streptomyces albiflavescens]